MIQLMMSFFISNITLSMAWANTSNMVPLRISIEGLRSGAGGVSITLFNQAQSQHFPIKPEQALIVDYKNLKGTSHTEFLIPNLPEGEYAAFAYHDEDGNKKINTNFVGIPTEGYGASQGATNAFGPPKYSDAKFLIRAPKSGEGESTIKIKVVY